jgi:MSHA biogenesis protein MshJ
MSSSFDKELTKLSTKFLEISLREQFLILFCGLVAVLFMMYTFLLKPILDHSERLQQNIFGAKKEIATLVEQETALTDKLKTDPNDPIFKRIKRLQSQIQKIDKELARQTNSLVPANKMATMLENVLTDSKGLTLVELQSIAPTPILLEQPKEGEEPKIGLYRHGVTLIFEGNYFDIQQHLEKLESLPWQFYWKKFDYLVGDYPTARVEIEIYTLSTNKAFIGVKGR